MKSLLKISRRYILTAVLIAGLVLIVNIAAFVGIIIYTVGGRSDYVNQRVTMQEIGQQIALEEGNYELSEAGYQLLDASPYQWAMRIDSSGNVVWSYQLPEEIPQHYTIADIGSLSRWYLEGYPVFVWEAGEGLMVYGMPVDSIARFAFFTDISLLRMVPSGMLLFLFLNILLIIGLALLFGFRFYRALKPVTEGIDRLSKQETVAVPERGMVSELLIKLNQTSLILKKQHEKLEQRDHARTEWIAGVSHDIRTPLALITGYADEIAMNEAVDTSIREKGDYIRRQSLLIGQLVSDLNLASKLEYQSQPLHKTVFRPATLLRECVTEYYNQGLDERYEIKLQVQPELEGVKLSGDTSLLLRAFRNLIGNSIRHNPDGCQISVGLFGAADSVRFVFSDSGNGIPDVVAESLMQENGLPAEAHIMGLRIVKQIIMAHDGQIRFEKKKSGGSYVVLIMAGE